VKLDDARPASPLIITAVVLAEATWLLLVWSWLFTLDGFLATTFTASALTLAIGLVLICGPGRLSLRDVGLTWRGIAGGLAIVAALWLVAQLVFLTAALGAGTPIALQPLGQRAYELVVSQIAGNALAEEVIYRGFLLVQLAVLASRWLPRRRAWVVALIGSQLIFALSHIPVRWITMDIHGAQLVDSLVETGGWGLVFALAYLRTGKLGVAVGFHALFNVPLALVASPLDPGLVYLVELAVLLVGWPLATRLALRFAPPRKPLLAGR
jgi:hypothetical protein